MTAPSHARLLHIFPSFGLGGVPLRICDIANSFGEDYRHIFVALDGDLSAKRRLASALDARCRALRLPRYRLQANTWQ